MATALVQPPPPFEPGLRPAQAWEEWRAAYELYEEACEYTTKPPGPRRALLLHVIGPAANKTYKGFNFPPPTATTPRETVTQILDKFGDLYSPYKNVTLASVMFNSIVQKPNQTIDELVSELKIQVIDCDYGDLQDRMVGDRIIIGIRDTALRERLLREPKLSLDKIINMCKSAEISKAQASTLQNPTATNAAVDSLSQKNFNTRGSNDGKFAHKTTRQLKNSKQHEQQSTCSRCATSHKPGNCPAYGSNCNKCGKFGHFAKVCRLKTPKSKNYRKVAELAERHDSDSDSDEEFTLGALMVDNLQQDEKWYQSIKVNNNKVTFKLDTGSDVNILPTTIMSTWKIKPQIRNTSSRITTYSGHKISLAGECSLHCATKDNNGFFTFHITDKELKPILGAKACEELGLIRRVMPNHKFNGMVATNTSLDDPQLILDAFPDVFEGVGKLPGTYKITLMPNAIPKIVAPRRVPQALEESVKLELKRMEDMGIIIKVTEPTEWVHPLVIARKKNGGIRICLDPRQLNAAVRREHYRIPTQEELFSKLQGCNIFSLLDAKDAFWHLELDKPSSMLCTFATQWGRYRFLRMPFGVNCAPEQFQRAMDETLQGNNFFPYFDDVLLAAKTQKEHCEQIFKFLTIAREKGLRLNRSKVNLGQKSITYLGHVLSPEGIAPDPTKVNAIITMKPPTNTIELMRFLGMITYLTKFVPGFSDKTKQLRSLLKTNTPWVWDENINAEFQEIKQLLTTAPVLRYFDINLPTVISTDASSYGVGSVLLQKHRPVAYASATLTQAQQSWSQIEKELLAIVFACERFHNYIYGTSIEVHTDHRPLVGLFNKPLEKITPRLQRLLCRLQKYDITLQYVPGKFLNVADTLSRAPTTVLTKAPVTDNDVTICMLARITTPKLKEIQMKTLSDSVLTKLTEYINLGWPLLRDIKDKDLRAYHRCRDELHVMDDLVCRGQRLILPKAAQEDALKQLHLAHRGMAACKNKARQALYWPTMDLDIEQMVSACLICQKHQNNNQREPIEDRQIPSRPWQRLALDFFHIKGSNYLLVVDYFSKFVEVQPMKTTTAKGVIAALKAIFARYGLPDELVSDNGPPMDSEEISIFFQEWDIIHNPSAPYNPRSNGMAERTVQTLKKSLIKADQDHKDLFIVLMDYRNTPVENLKSPAELLMGRKIRTFVPTLPENLEPDFDISNTRDQLQISQHKQHRHGDNHTKLLTPLMCEQEVWFALNKGWEPGKIVRIGPQKRSYIIQGQNGSHYRRNRYHIKPLKHKDESQSPLNTQTTKNTPEDYHRIDEPEVVIAPVANTVKTTRSGRTITLPARFRD